MPAQKVCYGPLNITTKSQVFILKTVGDFEVDLLEIAIKVRTSSVNIWILESSKCDNFD